MHNTAHAWPMRAPRTWSAAAGRRPMNAATMRAHSSAPGHRHNFASAHTTLASARGDSSHGSWAARRASSCSANASPAPAGSRGASLGSCVSIAAACDASRLAAWRSYSCVSSCHVAAALMATASGGCGRCGTCARAFVSSGSGSGSTWRLAPLPSSASAAVPLIELHSLGCRGTGLRRSCAGGTWRGHRTELARRAPGPAPPLVPLCVACRPLATAVTTVFHTCRVRSSPGLGRGPLAAADLAADCLAQGPRRPARSCCNTFKLPFWSCTTRRAGQAPPLGQNSSSPALGSAR